MKSERERKLENILAQIIKPIKNIPFQVVTKCLYGTEVYKFDLSDDDNKIIIKKISAVMRNVCHSPT